MLDPEAQKIEVTRRPHGEIWPDCPVKALGWVGSLLFFQDDYGQITTVFRLDKQEIIKIFGDSADQIAQHFPMFTKGGGFRKPTRWSVIDCALAMIAACKERGVFNPRAGAAQTAPRIARPQPARIAAVTSLLGAVLHDLTARDPESLSDAEADFWGCLYENLVDLQRIEGRAREEMGGAAVNILRTGAV